MTWQRTRLGCCDGGAITAAHGRVYRSQAAEVGPWPVARRIVGYACHPAAHAWSALRLAAQSGQCERLTALDPHFSVSPAGLETGVSIRGASSVGSTHIIVQPNIQSEPAAAAETVRSAPSAGVPFRCIPIAQVRVRGAESRRAVLNQNRPCQVRYDTTRRATDTPPASRSAFGAVSTAARNVSREPPCTWRRTGDVPGDSAGMTSKASRCTGSTGTSARRSAVRTTARDGVPARVHGHRRPAAAGRPSKAHRHHTRRLERWDCATRTAVSSHADGAGQSDSGQSPVARR